MELVDQLRLNRARDRGTAPDAAGPGTTLGRPRLRSDIAAAIAVMPAGGGSLEDGRTGRHFAIGGSESVLLRLMDGNRDLAELHRAAAPALGRSDLALETVHRFVARAQALGWLDESPRRVAGRPARWLAARLTLGTWRPLLGCLDTFIRLAYSPRLRPWFLCLMIAGALSGMLLPAIAAGGGATFGPPLPYLLAGFVLVSVVHELGHALTLRYFGRDSGQFGIMLLYGLPCFYSDVSSAWMLESKRQRVLVSLAGLGWQFCAAAVAAALLPVVDAAAPAGLLVRGVLAVSGLTALLNLNPLIRLDGYWVLSDVLGIPNLRRRAFEALGGLVRGSETWKLRRVLLALYGAASLLFTAALVVGLVLMAGRWAASIAF